MDTLFLIASKTGWFFLRPETILVLLLALPLVSLWRGRTDAARRGLSATFLVLLTIGLIPIGKFIVNPLERTYPANPGFSSPAGIIVLGGMEDIAPDYAGNIAQVNHAGERLIAAMELANRFREVPVLYSGGRVVLDPERAGRFQVGPDILRRLGLHESRLIVEDRSRTTAENAALALERITEQGEGHWVLVTSAWHMPRSLGTFCAAGWRNLIPFPVDYRGGNPLRQIRWNFAVNLEELNMGAKEWIGLLAYRMTGRTNAFLPTGCN